MISVVIPNFNGAPVLEACLTALAAQSVPEIEVILVDNGSTDDSLALARRTRPGVEIIAMKSNLGFAAAVNAGIKAARGRFVALLNNDVTVEPDWAAELGAVLERDPGTFAVGPKLLLDPERHRLNVVGIKLRENLESASIGAGQVDSGQFDRPGQVFGVSAGAAMYRRELFDEVGFFDEDFFAYLEDVDLSFRARLLGYRFRYAPRAQAYHRQGWTTRRMNNSFEIRVNSRNVLNYLVKNLPDSIWQSHRTRIILRQLELLIRYGVQQAHRGTTIPYLAGKLDFWRQRDQVLAKRAAIQAARRVPDQDIAYWLGLEVVPDED